MGRSFSTFGEQNALWEPFAGKIADFVLSRACFILSRLPARTTLKITSVSSVESASGWDISVHRAEHVFESKSRIGRIPLIAQLTPWLPKVRQRRQKKLEYFSPHSPHNTEAGGVPDVDLSCGSRASARDFLSQDFSPTSRSKSRLLFSCPSFSTQDNGFLENSPSRPSVLIMQHLLPPVVSLTLIALSFLLDSLIIPGFLFLFLPVWIFQGGVPCSKSFLTFWNLVDHLVTLTRLFLCLTLVPIAVRWLFLPPFKNISAVKFPSVAWQDLSLTHLFMTVLLLLLSTRWPSVTLTNEEWSSIWADSVVPQLMIVFLLVTFLESFWNWTIPLLMPLSRRLLHSVGVTCYTSAIHGERTANSPLIPTIIIYLVIRGTFSFTLTQF